MRAPGLALAALLALPAMARAQGTVLFSSYMTSATSGSNYGNDAASTDQKNVRWTGTQLSGCGAGSGLNVECWQFNETPGTGIDFGAAQFQHGWGFVKNLAKRNYGDPPLYWYTTWEYPSANTGQCGPASSPYICKVKLLTNPSSGTNCRSILELGVQGDAPAGQQVQVDMIIQPAGGSVGPDTGYTLSENKVYNMLVKITGSSGAGVADGRVDVWLAEYGTAWSAGSPTMSATGIALELGNAGCGSGEFDFGSYNNSEGLPVGAVHRLNLYRQQITTGFDAAWATTWAGAQAPPATVTRPRWRR